MVVAFVVLELTSAFILSDIPGNFYWN